MLMKVILSLFFYYENGKIVEIVILLVNILGYNGKWGFGKIVLKVMCLLYKYERNV